MTARNTNEYNISNVTNVFEIIYIQRSVEFDSFKFAILIWKFYPGFKNALQENQKTRYKLIIISTELKISIQ